MLDPDSVARKQYAEKLSILNSEITHAFAQGIHLVSATVTAPSAHHPTIGGGTTRSHQNAFVRPDIPLDPKKQQVGFRIGNHLTPDEAMNMAAYFSRGLYTPTRKPSRKEKSSTAIIPHAGTPEPTKTPHDFVTDATEPSDRDIRTWGSRHRIRLHTYSKRNVTLYRMLRVQHMPLVNTEAKEAANFARSKKFSEFHSLMKHQPIAPYYEEAINVYDEKTKRLRGYVTKDGEVALKPRWKLHFTPCTGQSETTLFLPKNRRNPLSKNKKESYIKESRQNQNSGANEIKIAID